MWQHHRIQGAPLPPPQPFFFKIMQFSSNFKGNPTILSFFCSQGPPPWSKNYSAPLWPKSWIRLRTARCTQCHTHVRKGSASLLPGVYMSPGIKLPDQVSTYFPSPFAKRKRTTGRQIVMAKNLNLKIFRIWSADHMNRILSCLNTRKLKNSLFWFWGLKGLREFMKQCHTRVRKVSAGLWPTTNLT